ncbi:MAG: hypothetical protein FWG73_05555 [Planctomycetaceae bacterium]|nr:hypothetical protein [Planctomycetaceae bacterium]
MRVTPCSIPLVVFALVLLAASGQPSSATQTNTADLLPFAEAKYNRDSLRRQTYSHGFQPSQGVVQENERLKNALEALNHTQDETEKRKQWQIIIEEFYENTLLPDAASILERLPETEQLRFLAACLKNANILNQQHRFWSGYLWGRNNERHWLDRGLCGTGIIQQMRYAFLKQFLLRRDFDLAEQLIQQQPQPHEGRSTVHAEFYVALPIFVFKEHAEVKDLNDYYRILAESEDIIARFCAHFELDQQGRERFREDLQGEMQPWNWWDRDLTFWMPADNWTCIATTQALFQDFDLAVESAQKIADVNQRHLVLFEIAMVSAFYGDMERALKMWENFPPAMFEEEFVEKIRENFAYYRFTGRASTMPDTTAGLPPDYDPRQLRKTYLLTLLLHNQLQGGIQAGSIPAKTVLPVIQGNTQDALVVFGYLYANRQIDELADMLDQYGFFDDGNYHRNAGSNPISTLCYFAKCSLLLGDKEESHRLLSIAFALMRKWGAEEGTEMKLKLMDVIADTRYQFEMYDHPETFTREELALSNPPGQTSDGLPWFMMRREEPAMRKREIEQAMQGFRYSENPFFAAAAKTALQNDNAEALVSTGKGLAKIGETELSQEYYRHAIAMVEKASDAGGNRVLPSLINIYGSIAQNLIATETESPLLDEIFHLLQSARSEDNYTHHMTTNAIVRLCIEMQNDALFAKFLQLVPEDHRDYLTQTMFWAKQQAELDAVQQGVEAAVREIAPIPLPVLETEFDFYANEFAELGQGRHPLPLLLKKMPTPDEARQAVQKVLDAKDEDLPEWLKIGEPLIEAIERLKALPQDGRHHLDSHLLALAHDRIRRGRLDDAQALAHAITHNAPKAHILLAVAFRKYDLADEEEKAANAEQFFQSFEVHQMHYGESADEEGRMDRYFRDDSYAAYVTRLVQRGLMERAEAVLDKITLPYQKSQAAYAIAVKYALNGEFEEALRFAQTVQDVSSGGFTSWDGVQRSVFGMSYSKRQTMAMILNMAASGNYGKQDFQPLQFMESLDTNDAKVHLLLAIVSGVKPPLRDSESAKNLLQKASELTRTIGDSEVRERAVLDLLPFLVEAEMSMESYRVAFLIDTTGDFATEQRDVHGSPDTAVPVRIADVVCLLITKGYDLEALELCQKVIDWIKPLRYDGRRADFWSNRANDIRNEIICRFAELQFQADSLDGYAARRTLDEERSVIALLAKRGPYLRRVAEALAKMGEMASAQNVYIEAISAVLGWEGIDPMHTDHDQFKQFDEIVESYVGFVR